MIAVTIRSNEIQMCGYIQKQEPATFHENDSIIYTGEHIITPSVNQCVSQSPVPLVSPVPVCFQAVSRGVSHSREALPWKLVPSVSHQPGNAETIGNMVRHKLFLHGWWLTRCNRLPQQLVYSLAWHLGQNPLPHALERTRSDS